MPLPPRLVLEVVTPDHAVVREEVDEVQLPGVAGYLGILPGHTPLLTSLRVGQLWYRQGAEKRYLAIAFGFAEVQPDRVRLLAQVAERAEEIDVARAEERRRRAETAVQAARSGSADIDLERARISLLKSIVRIQVAAKAKLRG
ncbi:MAG TPA: F0F1 ATP synthase subunit epsilon [Vicinamibacterales bacterium]|nr:F0F1 ATP synthase subunit epsilon [Vicinamibacterales bacterium]HOG27775.1 F0F1 ATP synthase subunit epsilon [Vicinamibacterales bacterium]HOQ60591.1 F0F1 ATP synthase subunit epsilon [Vicinamibacterales bacterium]HPK70896.1 F0F1 ATP synthase subunit epsilon [Vicinamibacterales bacterium]HPW21030.1 F0F1 ATP synthase subunit epsilon [Vicinamibacterales bacterium]